MTLAAFENRPFANWRMLIGEKKLARVAEIFCTLFGMETPKIREFQHKRRAVYRATISCAIGIAVLASCASQEATTRLNVAEAEITSLRNSKLMVFFELIDPSLSEEQKAAEEKRMFEAMTPCMITYGERLEAALDYAMQAVKDHGNRGPAYRLASYAERLDEFYSSCVASYGGSGYNYMETMDGRELRLPDYIRSFMASAESRQRARSQVLYEEQQNAMVFSAIALGLVVRFISTRTYSQAASLSSWVRA